MTRLDQAGSGAAVPALGLECKAGIDQTLPGGEDLFLVVILSVETLDDGAAVVGAELLGHGDLLNELSEKQACGDTADDSDSDVVVAVECLATVEHHSTFAVTVIVERVAEMT